MTVRMPSVTERRAYRLSREGPALEIRRENGIVEIIDAALTEIIFVPGDSGAGEPAAGDAIRQSEEDAQRG